MDHLALPQTVTAQAPANIALIKYWGQYNSALNIPNNGSISFNLSQAHTTTTVTFQPDLTTDSVIFNGRPAPDVFVAKVTKQLNNVRKLARKNWAALVETSNDFPTGCGIASSASGMAALSLAASHAIGLRLSTSALSRLSRLGSGSACRSIPDGFVKWLPGKTDRTSYALSLYPADYWEIHDVVVVVDTKDKAVPSLAGHQTATTSLLYNERLRSLPISLQSIENALRDKDFTLLGSTAEAEALNMHAIMMTSQPSLIYWSSATLLVIEMIKQLRSNNHECYFTIDAGANVHILSLAKDVQAIRKMCHQQSFITRTIDNIPTTGARIISTR